MALVTLPTPQVIPSTFNGYLTSGGLLSASAVTINDDTDEVAFVCQIPKTGTLTDLTFLTGTITTGENAVPVRIETVGTDGNPSGTLYVANATGTVNIADTDDNVLKAVSINGGTGVSCTVGDIVAVRAKRNGSGTLNGGVFKYSATLGFGSLPSLRDYNVTGAAAWTKTYVTPFLAFNIGGWVAPLGCIGAATAAPGGEAYQTAAERGLQVNFPVSVRAIGAVALVNLAAGTSVKFNLYSTPAGTPASQAVTPDIDTDMLVSTNARPITAMFTAPFTLAANTDYVLAMTPQGATNLTLSYWIVDATYLAAAPAGADGTWWARANGSSAFAETTTKVPLMGLIIDQIDNGPTPDYPDVGNVTEDDTVNGATGTYHEATVAEVQSGIAFGASSALTGTYTGGSGGGGPLVGPSALVS